jgi:adenosylhomocysteine nucleosidase
MALHNNGYGPVGRLAKPPVEVLICFAVKEEMKFFPSEAWKAGGVQVWVTGIGRRNAAQNIRDAIARVQPERVITAGFAGGLNPRLRFGAVVYEQDFDAGFGRELEELGAIASKFHCHRRVATTAAEKSALWQETGADAVEMESSVIRTICREFKIPSATVRVISDDARQDLPLDFNALMTAEDRINYLKLMWAVFSRPGRIPKLIQFQRQTLDAARRLDAVLEDLLILEDLLGVERR